MKKQNVLNLIKYHVEKNENSFRNEAINIARYFDSIGDDQLAEYIMSLIAESNMYTPQSSDFESEFLKQTVSRQGFSTKCCTAKRDRQRLSTSAKEDLVKRQSVVLAWALLPTADLHCLTI